MKDLSIPMAIAPLATPGDGGRYRRFSRWSTIALLSVAAAFAQTCPSSSALYPSGFDGDAQLGVAPNSISTFLNAALTSGATTLSVISPAGMVANQYLSINSEIVFLTATSPLTIARGCDGTTAAPHLNGAAVQGRINAGYHNTMRKAVEALEKNASIMGINAGSYNFSQSPGVALIAGGVDQPIPLTPCPYGVNGTDSSHYVYLSGGVGTAEATLIDRKSVV